MKPISILHCIVNPHAGGGQTGKRWPKIARGLAAAGFEVVVKMTAGPGEATAYTREALAGGARTVVAVGGDGTIHEVVNGFFENGRLIAPDARLGILPGGSGSDFIKTLGIPDDALDAITRLVEDRSRPIDLGLARFVKPDGSPGSLYYVNSASIGMSAAVLAKMRALPGFVTGSMAYLAGSLGVLGRFKPFEATLAYDDAAPVTRRALMVLANNGRFFGGGMAAAPHAALDDERLDAVVVNDGPAFELFMGLVKMYIGNYLEMKQVDFQHARRLLVETAEPVLVEIDGEQPGVTPASFEVVPGALRVVV